MTIYIVWVDNITIHIVWVDNITIYCMSRQYIVFCAFCWCCAYLTVEINVAVSLLRPYFTEKASVAFAHDACRRSRITHRPYQWYHGAEHTARRKLHTAHRTHSWSVIIRWFLMDDEHFISGVVKIQRGNFLGLSHDEIAACTHLRRKKSECCSVSDSNS